MTKGRTKGAGSPPLPPLDSEAQTLLAQRLAEVQRALAAGAGTEELAGLWAPHPPDPAWDDQVLAALARLAHPGIPPLLVALFGRNPDRGRRKALKRALHFLRTKGVPVAADLLPREARAAPPVSGPEVAARVSPPLGTGERYAVLEGSRQLLGGTVLVARVSDTAGLLELHPLEARRAQREELWQHFREQGLGEWAEVSPAYVVRLLEEAFSLNPGAAAAQDYAALRGRLWQHLGRPEEAPDPEAAVPPLSEPELGPALERARQMARSPFFHSWLPGPEELAPWVQKIQEAEASPLVLSEHQQKARLEGILAEAARALFPADHRGLWRRRLLHLAYFFQLKGFLEEARAARAAAQDLASRADSQLLGESPFLLALVHFALILALDYQRQAEPPATGSGLVAPPDASPLILKR